MPEVNLNEKNFAAIVAAYMEKSKLEMKPVAKAIGCPIPSLGRLLYGKTLPSEEMLKRAHTLMEIGYEDYCKLSEADKEKISEAIGAVGGGGLGIGASIGAISALGSVGGLSAAGITSGLAALGSVIGGGMVAGVAVACTIPIAVGALGYGVVLLVKKCIGDAQLNSDVFEPRWEKPLKEQ